MTDVFTETGALRRQIMGSVHRFSVDLGLRAQVCWVPQELFYELERYALAMYALRPCGPADARFDGSELRFSTAVGTILIAPHRDDFIAWSFDDRQPHPLDTKGSA